MSFDYVSNQEIIQAARRNLPQDVWDYLTGGAESETTMRRNRLGFDCLGLRPRVLVDVSKVDTSTTFLGQKLRIPVMMAPIGSLQTITPEGGAAVAKAAAEFGTMNFLSSVTQPSLEEVAACTNHPKIFQLYIRGGLDWCAEIVGAGEKSRLHRALPHRRHGALQPARAAAAQPLEAAQPPPKRAHSSGDAHLGGGGAIKKIAGMPLIIKGIATAEDAKIAVDHGVDVIYISNHGGRQFDHGLGTIDTLPEIARAVNGKTDYTRRRNHPRHRRRESFGAWCQRRHHRQTPRLGFGRGRSSWPGEGARAARGRDHHRHGVDGCYPHRSDHAELRLQSDAGGVRPRDERLLSYTGRPAEVRRKYM